MAAYATLGEGKYSRFEYDGEEYGYGYTGSWGILAETINGMADYGAAWRDGAPADADYTRLPDLASICGDYDGDGVANLNEYYGQNEDLDHYLGAVLNADTTDSAPAASNLCVDDEPVSMEWGRNLFYNAANGYVYWLNAIEVPWPVHQAFAQALETVPHVAIPGNLATVDSEALNVWLRNTIVSTIDEAVWIGGTDADTEGTSEGTWIWIATGTPYWQGKARDSLVEPGEPVNGAYANWMGGEPNDYRTGEDFAVMSRHGGWYDDDRPDSAPAIVEFSNGGAGYTDANSDGIPEDWPGGTEAPLEGECASDSEAPVITACACDPAPLGLDDNCEAVLPDLTGSLLATDNCGVPAIKQTPPAGTTISSNTLVTLAAVDAAGLMDTWQVNVRVGACEVGQEAEEEEVVVEEGEAFEGQGLSEGEWEREGEPPRAGEPPAHEESEDAQQGEPPLSEEGEGPGAGEAPANADGETPAQPDLLYALLDAVGAGMLYSQAMLLDGVTGLDRDTFDELNCNGDQGDVFLTADEVRAAILLRDFEEVDASDDGTISLDEARQAIPELAGEDFVLLAGGEAGLTQESLGACAGWERLEPGAGEGESEGEGAHGHEAELPAEAESGGETAPEGDNQADGEPPASEEGESPAAGESKPDGETGEGEEGEPEDGVTQSGGCRRLAAESAKDTRAWGGETFLVALSMLLLAARMYKH